MRAGRGVSGRVAVAGLLAGALVIGGASAANAGQHAPGHQPQHAVQQTTPRAAVHLVRAGGVPDHRPAGNRAGYVVNSFLVLLHAGPHESDRIVFMLGRGRRITASTTTVNGFRQISRFCWVEAKYLVPAHK